MIPNYWTAVEDAILRHDWPDVRRIMARTGRNLNGVDGRARKLGLPKRPPLSDLRFWTEEEDALLTELYHTHPTARVAKMLGKSRGSVIGRAYRLGLSKSTPSSRARRIKARERAEVVIPPPPPPSPPPLIGTLLRDLRRQQCRWPLAGEGLNTQFCGNPQHEGSSYCQFHERRSRKVADEAIEKIFKPARSRLHMVRFG